MLLKLITIDDEKYVRDFLIESIKVHFKDEIIISGVAGSVKDSLSLIHKVKPDIVLLDIELEDGTSFEILEQLEELSFELIFITGFDDKAIKAIKFGALDYLLKPVDVEELQLAIQKAILNITSNIGKTLLQMTRVANDFYKNDQSCPK